MYVSCSICRELFSSESKVCATQCGHLYHDLCLDKWREESETCPHCRSQIKEIIREVELKFKEIVDENVGDPHRYQLMHDFKVVKEQEKLLKEKYENLNSFRLQLKQLISDNKNDIKNSEFDIIVWETQLSMYNWVQDAQRQLLQENEEMKNKVDLLEKLDRLIHGTELEMYEILTGMAISSSTVKELCTLVQAMKYKLKKNGNYYQKKIREILQMSEEFINNQNSEEENEEVDYNMKKEFVDKAVQVDPKTIQKFRRKLLKKAILNSNVLCAMGQRPRTRCQVEEQNSSNKSGNWCDDDDKNIIKDTILERIT